MIDIHSHILPNVDDGARNIDETLALLKEARSSSDLIQLLLHHIIWKAIMKQKLQKEKY